MMRPKDRLFLLQWLLFAAVFMLSSAYSVSAQALLQTGAQAPEFSLKDVGGKTVSLSDFSKNKAVVLVFWSTWSDKSKKALKRFEEFHGKYQAKGVQVIGINTDNQTMSAEDIEKVKKTAADWGISFPVVVDRGLDTFRAYSAIALPSTVVVVDGKISYELPGLPLVGTESLFDYLLTLAGEQPKTKAAPKYQPRHDAIADTNLARGFVKKKMKAMAYPYFKKAIEKDPEYMLPYVELAKLQELDGDSAAAEETLKAALGVKPEHVVVLSEFGYLLTREGKIKEAVPLLEKAVSLNSFTPAHYYYAYALGKAGKTAEAMSAFKDALDLNPFEPAIYLLRAEIDEDTGMTKEAAEDYRKTLELKLKVTY
jgi:Tfp pilus assembly protein PilF/peroxiredoxin